EMTGHGHFWRRLLLAACREGDAAGCEPLPGEACADRAEWDLLLGCLTDRIFWDDDYELAHQFLDAPPGAGRAEMAALGIADDYHRARAPDPDPDGLEAVRRALHEVTGRPRPEGAGLPAGLEDRHHGLLVGPCNAEAVAREAACPLLHEVAADAGAFDCSYPE